MKHFYFVKILIILFAFSINLNASLKSKSAVVYYGDNIPYSLFGVHEYIILEPDFVNVYSSGFKTYKDNIYAYVSVNEMLKTRSFAKEAKKSWVIGKNGAWGSEILNIANPGYQKFLLNRVIGELHKKGFQNFFFDTMDSYQLANVSESEKQNLRLGLIQFIKKFKQQYPNSKLITNRGFEIIDEVHTYIDALLFESYYHGINANTMSYVDVTQNDRNWLDIQLAKVKKYNIPIIALDYLPSFEKKKQQNNVKALQKKGFIPYVTTKELTNIGLSSKNAVKREVLIIYNSKNLDDNLVNFSNAHRLASMPLEYLGYVPILRDVNKPLPKEDLNNRYAGIIIWLEDEYNDFDKLIKWAKLAISKNVKVLFLGDASLNIKHPLISSLGLHSEKNLAKKNRQISTIVQDKMFGFEIQPSISYHQNLIQVDASKTLFSYQNEKNQKSTIAAIMPWGGFVRDDLLVNYLNKNNIWVVDPFKLFKLSLSLASIPIPDTTTENGKRLMFLHIDGDGSMNRIENNVEQFSIELILNDFIKKYPFPQSVSIVESETAPHGMYPKLSSRLEKAAKEMFKLPHVEGATHTYSHPFYWQKLEKDPGNERYRIPVKNYTFSAKRDIGGSLDYVNERLMPKNKPKAKAVFWTGDCAPSENILHYTHSNDIININGGDTIITNDHPWLALVQPLGLKLGDYYQVYTGQQNENVYTNDWLGPFWGFKKVIQTFNLTDKPRRLKPVNVYYHFYSASKRASYIALKDIYDWVVKQDFTHIFTSEYPAKVTNFYDASLAKEGNSWLLRGFDNLRTLRIPKTMGYPIMKKSYGIAGYKDAGKDLYVHLDQKRSKILTLGSKNKDQNYLIDANARLVSKKGDLLHLKGYMPISLSYKLKPGCRLMSTENGYSAFKKADNIVSLKFKNAKDLYVTQKCSN